MLVDSYVRARLSCFLAELDLRANGAEYVLCFRRTDTSRDSSRVYDCKYIRTPSSAVATMVQSDSLSQVFQLELDQELSSLLP